MFFYNFRNMENGGCLILRVKAAMPRPGVGNTCEGNISNSEFLGNFWPRWLCEFLTQASPLLPNLTKIKSVFFHQLLLIP